jgi:hypothetical protein
VIAVIAEDEVLAWRDDQLTILDETWELLPPVGVDIRVGVDGSWEDVAGGIV